MTTAIAHLIAVLDAADAAKVPLYNGNQFATPTRDIREGLAGMDEAQPVEGEEAAFAATMLRNTAKVVGRYAADHAAGKTAPGVRNAAAHRAVVDACNAALAAMA